jgi:DNA-binding NarL/FixJ family response regulator
VIRILIVDDSPEFLEAAATLLSAHPHVQIVGTARSAAHAMQLIREHAPHLVLMEAVMPGVSGITVIKRIVELPSPPEVVIVTFYNSVELQRQAKAVGAAAVVHKNRLVEDVFPLIDARVPGAGGPPAAV